MALRMSMQQPSSPEPKRSKPRENAGVPVELGDELPEAKKLKLQRELMAAAAAVADEKRMMTLNNVKNDNGLDHASLEALLGFLKKPEGDIKEERNKEATNEAVMPNCVFNKKKSSKNRIPLNSARKGTYLHQKEIKAPESIKISAQDLEHAVAGLGLYVVDPDDDLV